MVLKAIGGEKRHDDLLFHQLSQCMTTISGIGGWCYQNPGYNGARNSVPAPRRRRH
jgi:hypothetical protein